jgi:hypothetical protein
MNDCARRCILALALIFISSVRASAATITVEQTLDITKTKNVNFGVGFQGWQDSPAFNGGVDVQIAPGDTLDFTIKFLTGQSLSLTNPTFAWALLLTNSPNPSEVNGTGTLSFLDAAGVPILTSNSRTDDEGDAHFGQQYGGGDFSGGLPASLTFSGVHYVGVLNSYAVPTEADRHYVSVSFIYGVASVPEPSTFALIGIGVLGLGCSAAHRRKMLC